MAALSRDGTLTAGRDDERAAPPEPLLFIVLQAARPLSGSRRLRLSGVDEVVIGRGEEACIRHGRRLELRLPDPRLSSRHASLRLEDGVIELRDLDSKNGCFVNGGYQRQLRLADGDMMELGSTFFRLRQLPLAAGEDDLRLDWAAEPAGMQTVLPSLAASLALFGRVAASTVPLIILGDSGTGKELAARAAHARSRRSGSFVAVNCGALAPSLAEAELFGHRKGAFTGALEDRPGLIRAADGGTLFLDEVAELTPHAQTLLLRALEEQAVRPVGGVAARPLEVRTVCATHRDLPALAAAGQFRSDLLARLSGFTLRLPPLRDRREDLGLIVATLLRALANERAQRLALTPAAGRLLLGDAWPMNVRALQRCIATALVIADDSIDASHLQASSLLQETLAPAPAPRRLSDQELRRREQLAELLTRHAGNISAAARELGKTRMQIRRWMKRYQLS